MSPQPTQEPSERLPAATSGAGERERERDHWQHAAPWPIEKNAREKRGSHWDDVARGEGEGEDARHVDKKMKTQ